MSMLDITWTKAEPNKWDHPRSERWEAKVGKQRIGRFEADTYTKMDGVERTSVRIYSNVAQGCRKEHYTGKDSYDIEETKSYIEEKYFTFLKNIGVL